MKKVLIALCFLIPVFGFSQTDSSWIFSKTIQLDSVSKGKIFAVAKEFFINHDMGTGKQFVLEMATGTISGAGSFPAVVSRGLSYSDKGVVVYTFKFLSKDGKCKITLSNFEHFLIMANGGSLTNEKPKCGNFAISQKVWGKIKEASKKQADLILSQFEITMKKLITNKEDF
jgi:hypothetical protein